MSLEQNKALVQRTMGELDRRNLDAVIATYRPDATFHGFAPVTLDVNGYRQMMSGLLAAFPDSRFFVRDIVAEGDRVVARHTMEGTQQGAFLGIPASGKHVTVEASAMFRIQDAKVTEIWLNADFLGMLQQIGAVPAMSQA
jgi:steroid delta-isomerase-like uncharacterized protein